MEEKEIIFEEKVQRFGVAFVCDLKCDCNISSDCVKNGGDCTHTFDPRHASNFSFFLEVPDKSMDVIWFMEQRDVVNEEEDDNNDFSE